MAINSIILFFGVINLKIKKAVEDSEVQEFEYQSFMISTSILKSTNEQASSIYKQFHL